MIFKQWTFSRRAYSWTLLFAVCALGLGVSVGFETSAQQSPDTAVPQRPTAPQDPSSDEGQRLIDEAMQLKLSATQLKDLDRVIELCERAMAAGLDETNRQFAQQLISGTLYERAFRLIEPVLNGQIDISWTRRRDMALESLTRAVELDPQDANSLLLLAKLHVLPGGDLDMGRASAAKAVDLFKGTPARRAEALVINARYADTPEAQIGMLDEAIATDPENREARRLRAEVKLVAKDIAGAIDDLKLLLQQDPENVETLEQIVKALAGLGQFDEALAYVDQAIALEPKAAEAYYLRSSIRMMQDQTEEALKDLDEAYRLAPDNLAVLMTRSRLRVMLEQFDEALHDVNRLLELRPGLGAALLLRVDIHLAQEDFANAILDMKRLLSNDATNQGLLFRLAGIYLADQRPRRAIEVYSQIIQDEDDAFRDMAYRGRGDAHLAIGKHAEAIKDFASALELEDEDPGLLNNFAWVLSTSPDDQLRDAKRGLELAEKACELTEYGQAHILSTLAACYAELGQWEDAVKWSRKSVELADGDVLEQLNEELASFENQKPWREKQQQEENSTPEPQLGLDDDLVVDLPKEEPSRNTERSQKPGDMRAPAVNGIPVPADP